ncbi:hypothetical protein Tco_0309269 [Tanacetum coccineum]
MTCLHDGVPVLLQQDSESDYYTASASTLLAQYKLDPASTFSQPVFKDILNIYPRIQVQEFNEPTTEEEALYFIYELGHSGEIKYITNVIVDPNRIDLA